MSHNHIIQGMSTREIITLPKLLLQYNQQTLSNYTPSTLSAELGDIITISRFQQSNFMEKARSLKKRSEEYIKNVDYCRNEAIRMRQEHSHRFLANAQLAYQVLARSTEQIEIPPATTNTIMTELKVKYLESIDFPLKWRQIYNPNQNLLVIPSHRTSIPVFLKAINGKMFWKVVAVKERGVNSPQLLMNYSIQLLPWLHQKYGKQQGQTHVLECLYRSQLFAPMVKLYSRLREGTFSFNSFGRQSIDLPPSKVVYNNSHHFTLQKNKSNNPNFTYQRLYFKSHGILLDMNQVQVSKNPCIHCILISQDQYHRILERQKLNFQGKKTIQEQQSHLQLGCAQSQYSESAESPQIQSKQSYLPSPFLDLVFTSDTNMKAMLWVFSRAYAQQIPSSLVFNIADLVEYLVQMANLREIAEELIGKYKVYADGRVKSWLYVNYANKIYKESERQLVEGIKPMRNAGIYLVTKFTKDNEKRKEVYVQEVRKQQQKQKQASSQIVKDPNQQGESHRELQRDEKSVKKKGQNQDDKEIEDILNSDSNYEIEEKQPEEKLLKNVANPSNQPATSSPNYAASFHYQASHNSNLNTPTIRSTQSFGSVIQAQYENQVILCVLSHDINGRRIQFYSKYLDGYIIKSILQYSTLEILYYHLQLQKRIKHDNIHDYDYKITNLSLITQANEEYYICLELREDTHFKKFHTNVFLSKQEQQTKVNNTFFIFMKYNLTLTDVRFYVTRQKGNIQPVPQVIPDSYLTREWRRYLRTLQKQSDSLTQEKTGRLINPRQQTLNISQICNCLQYVCTHYLAERILHKRLDQNDKDLIRISMK